MTEHRLDWKFHRPARHLHLVDAGNILWCNVAGLFQEGQGNHDGNYPLVRLSQDATEQAMGDLDDPAIVTAKFFGPRGINALGTTANAVFIKNEHWDEWLVKCGMSMTQARKVAVNLERMCLSLRNPEPIDATIATEKATRSGDEFDEVALRILQSLITAGSIPRQYGQANGYDYVASAYAMAKEVWSYRVGERAP